MKEVEKVLLPPYFPSASLRSLFIFQALLELFYAEQKFIYIISTYDTCCWNEIKDLNFINKD